MAQSKKMFKISGAMIALLLPIILLLTILQIHTFDKDFYLKEFIKYDVPKVTKIDIEDLDRITVKMLNYLKDEDNNLNITADVDGKTREVFGQREKDHMVDVKVLFINGRILRNTALLILVVAFVIRAKVSQNKLKDIHKSLLQSSIISLSAMLLLFILIEIDFYKYFTYFHEIFFDNDLWLLNPETDVLIQMLPLEFFIDISTRVIGWFVASMVVLGGLSFRKLRTL